MKICTGCKVEKSYDEFGKVKKAFDGLNQKCKKCCNERAKHCIRSQEAIENSRKTSLEWQKRNRKMLNERCKVYYLNNLEERREYLKGKQKEYMQTEKGKKKHKERSVDFRKRNPEKIAAQQKCRRAIKKGTLVRPKNCSECQVFCKPHAHHEDYNKPLEVIWLCDKCHLHTHQGHKFHRERLSALAPDKGDTKV
jgi:hypothetical protein